jgi:hypothetical protein
MLENIIYFAENTKTIGCVVSLLKRVAKYIICYPINLVFIQNRINFCKYVHLRRIFLERVV